MKTPTIHDLRVQAGFKSQKAFLEALGVSGRNAAFGVKLDKGKLPSNHPLIPTIARVLKQPEADIQRLCVGKPMDEKSVKMVATAMQQKLMQRGSHGGQALVPTQQKPSALVAVTATRNRRNSLTRLDHRTRQAARSLADNANMHIVSGRRYLEVVPVDDLYLVLNDYFERHGIRDKLVLPPQYAEHFG